ncbi:hypothetical protein BJ165DRAFT_1533574 [Panaeolus papilionaceus]|nr:hypothetical protein BJ165DRAFT_1533574 [Panaeolus papilionaceus]
MITRGKFAVCVLVSQLSEKVGITVLVLEAGTLGDALRDGIHEDQFSSFSAVGACTVNLAANRTTSPNAALPTVTFILKIGRHLLSLSHAQTSTSSQTPRHHLVFDTDKAYGNLYAKEFEWVPTGASVGIAARTGVGLEDILDVVGVQVAGMLPGVTHVSKSDLGSLSPFHASTTPSHSSDDGHRILKFRTQITEVRFNVLSINDFVAQGYGEEILHRSKADLVAKYLVIGQIAWLCLQVTTRQAANLDVMQLEIWIFPFAISTLVIYVLWWDKPFMKYQLSTKKQYDSPQAGEFGLNVDPKIRWWP